MRLPTYLSLTQELLLELMMQYTKLPVPPAAEVAASHVHVEGHEGPARVALHHHAVVRNGDRQRPLIRVIILLVNS